MTRLPRRNDGRRPGTGVVAGLVILFALSACASTSSTTTPPPANEPAPAESTSEDLREPLEPLPENVATAIVLGSMFLESGNVRTALPYYRFAWDSTPGDPAIGRRFVEVALRAGSADEALLVLEQLVAADPGAVDLAMQRAELLALTGKPQQALEAVDVVLERTPDDDYARALRIDLLQDTGRTEEALAAVETMIDDDPAQAAWHVQRGDLLMELGRDAEAERAWRTALTLDGSSVDAVDRYVELLRGEGREDELIDVLTELAADGELGAAQQLRLADLFLARGDRASAVDLLMPLAARGALDERERRIVADLLASLDRQDDAIDVLRPLLGDEGTATADVHRVIGELRMEKGDFEGAVEMLEQAVELDPGDGDAHVSLLLALSQATPGLFDGTAPASERRRFERGLSDAEPVIEDRSVRQNFLMGALLRRAGRTERAQRYLEQAAALQPENDQILYDLAAVQETNEDYDGARATLEKLLALSPDDPHLKNFYGYLLADRGWELKRALRLIQEAVDAEPDNGAYIDSLGWVLFRLGRHEEALDHLIDAVNRLGDDPIVLEHLAECLAALERYEEALTTFQRARAVAEGDEGAHLDARIRAMQDALREGP